MKLKFKAEAQDVVIFIIFAIFLLYIVCLAVLNLPNLAAEGTFYGLNPIDAFDSDHVAATIMFYLLALGGIFASVSSYFFEMESGIGFGFGKKTEGYSRWAKQKEITSDKGIERVDPHAERTNAAGVPLVLKENEVYVDNGEYHTLVIGATGSGKTQTVIFPMVQLLAKHGESMIITDPKGEIYETESNMLREKGYQILILNFRDPQRGSSWNPLALPYEMYKNGNQDKAIELLDDLAANILYDEKSSNADPFWEKTSADYFSGIALGMFEDAKPDEININSISLMTTVGEEKFGGSTYVKEYFSAKDPSSAAAINASSTIMAPNETKGSILAVFKQKIKLFASRENLSEMLSHSDVDLASIGKQKTALFIVIQDEKKTYHSLVTILLKQCYETLIAVAQENGGKLPVRTNFLLDEFANMPPLKDITTMITAARSRLIRFTMIIQNFAQLDEVYGKENAETLKGNCGNIIYLITSELKALEEISKMCGEKKSKKDDKTASTPLVTVSDLQRMKQFEVIIIRLRMQPFRTKFTPNFKMNWGKTYPKADYPEREKQPVHTFDIREFVKKQKKEKVMQMLNESSGGNAGGSLPGGFAGSLPGPFGNMGLPNTQGAGTPKPNPFASTVNPNVPNPTVSSPKSQPTSSVSSTQAASATVTPKKPEATKVEDEFNVDELVRKIDAKIAELEKQSSEAEKKPPVAPPTQVSKGQQTPSILDSKSDMEPVLNQKPDLLAKPQTPISGTATVSQAETLAPFTQTSKIANAVNQKFTEGPTKEVAKPDLMAAPTTPVSKPTTVVEHKPLTAEDILGTAPIQRKQDTVIKHINENEIAPVELEASDDTFFDDFFDTDDE